MHALFTFSSSMIESPINIRFKKTLIELEQLLNQIKNENKIASDKLEKFEIFPRLAFQDAIYSVIKSDQLSLRIVLMNVPTLASNVSKILACLLIPYRLKIDAGAMLLTPSFDLYPYHASRNSALELENYVIRDGDDIQMLMYQLGWSYDSSEKVQSNARFIEMLIDNQENRFGIHSNSKFNFAELCYVELYIDCNQLLVKRWHEGIGYIEH